MPIIKYGDSTVIMQHATTCLWVSYKVRGYKFFVKQPNIKFKKTTILAYFYDLNELHLNDEVVNYDRNSTRYLSRDIVLVIRDEKEGRRKSRRETGGAPRRG